MEGSAGGIGLRRLEYSKITTPFRFKQGASEGGDFAL